MPGRRPVFFNDWVRAPFVFIFLFVSGICCSFSKNNFLRAAKTAVVAALFSAVFWVVSILLQSEMYVFFNVLHLLTLGTLAYAVLSFLEQKKRLRGVNAILLFSGILFVWLAYPMSKLTLAFQPLLLPFYEGFAQGIGMADYMPIVPWLGMFFFGALFGRLYYRNRQTLFPNASAKVKLAASPVEFVGRHALLFYVLHQPIILGVLYLLEILGIIK